MRGTVFVEFQNFIRSKLGDTEWQALLEKAKVKPNKHYMRLHSYPDTEIDRILAAVAEYTNSTRAQLLEEFGIYLGNYIFKSYAAIIDPNWTTIDSQVNTQFHIKEIFTTLTWDDNPPFYEAYRISPTEGVQRYSSSRKMCHLIVGVIKAAALHYNEEVIITQPKCMLNGDIECEIHAKLIGKKKS